jgi:chromosomal replication initiator protein
MYLSRKMTDASFPQIGDQFGGRDHTTVMHAIEKLEKELITDQDLEATIKLLCKNIEES